jgi:hypothetical protein
VGVVYNDALADRLLEPTPLVDALSLIPETLWHESPDSPRYRWIEGSTGVLDAVRGTVPIVFHGIGLSLGSGLPLDLGHLEQVVAAAERYQPAWYSEHLSAFRLAAGSSGPVHACVGLPVPLDGHTLRELVPKVGGVVDRLGMPVLLENSAIYVEVPGAEMSEAQFLNRLGEEAGSGVLLDLHNLVVNEINLGWNAEVYLSELDLSQVVEIHVAGGEMLGRWYTDAHSGACPDRVWALLDAVVPAAPALRLITFESHESRYPRLGVAGLEAQLARIRTSMGKGAICVA